MYSVEAFIGHKPNPKKRVSMHHKVTMVILKSISGVLDSFFFAIMVDVVFFFFNFFISMAMCFYKEMCVCFSFNFFIYKWIK